MKSFSLILKAPTPTKSSPIFFKQYRSIKSLKLFFIVLSAVTLIATMTASCRTQTTPAAEAADDAAMTKKLNIIATLFPHYDFTREIVGDRANITLLLPPGVESHSYEPTPADIIVINRADLFIYTGASMENWAGSILEGISNENIHVLGLADKISLYAIENSEYHEHDHDYDHRHDQEHVYSYDNEHDQDHDNFSHSHDHDRNHEGSNSSTVHFHEYDPHIWTSPVIAGIMVDEILSAVCELDPDNAKFYTENANSYKEKLEALDNEFRNIVSNSPRREIYVGDRFALLYFAEEYGLGYHAAFDSCSDETEPSADVIANMIDQIIEKQVPVIYYAELSDPKIARLLSEETGAEMLLLHSCHNVTKEEFDKGVTYIDLMSQNAENLRKGLS